MGVFGDGGAMGVNYLVNFWVEREGNGMLRDNDQDLVEEEYQRQERCREQEDQEYGERAVEPGPEAINPMMLAQRFAVKHFGVLIEEVGQ